MLLHKLGQLDAAEALLRESVEGTRCVMGPAHPDTRGSIAALAALLRARGRRAEAARVERG